MNLRNKWTMGLLSLGAVAIVGVSATTLYSTVYAQTETPDQAPIADEQRLDRGHLYMLQILDLQSINGGEEASALLAEVLGISEEQLQAAQTTVRNAAIDQAVADGRITQEQADQMKAEEGERAFGWGPKGAGGDYEAALAAALGITVEELEAAQAEVKDRLIEEAVASGEITQEEADLMAAREAMREFLRDQNRAAYEEAIAQAVTDGVITQAQADLLLSEENAGFFGPGMGAGPRGDRQGGRADGPFGGPNGGPGRGQPPADSPLQPDSETPDSSSVPITPSDNIDL